MYDDGHGVEQNYQEAAKWFHRAAEQGIARAEHSLGLMYYNGKGLEQNFIASAKWLHRAAVQDVPQAQVLLGAMYVLGQGVEQDLIYAHMWTNIAAHNGADLSIKLRKEIEELMTPQQIADAQAMARACLESQYKNC